MKLIQSAGEVMPDSAEGSVAELYDEIRSSLRVPVINFIFRVLATEPRRLEVCWSAVRPFIRLVELERQADALRSASVFGEEIRISSVEHAMNPELRKFTQTIHYVLPKLLLIATALIHGLRGEEVGPDTADRDAEIPAGPAEGTGKLELLSVDETGGEVRRILEDIRELHQHPGVASYYRAVARYPDFLSSCWSELRPRIKSRGYDSAKSALISQARTSSRRLPMNVGTLQELSSEAASETLSMLEVFRQRLIPDLLLDVTLIRTWTDGPSEASRSPYPL